MSCYQMTGLNEAEASRSGVPLFADRRAAVCAASANEKVCDSGTLRKRKNRAGGGAVRFGLIRHRISMGITGVGLVRVTWGEEQSKITGTVIISKGFRGLVSTYCEGKVCFVGLGARRA
jgi:hypothetical protein